MTWGFLNAHLKLEIYIDLFVRLLDLFETLLVFRFSFAPFSACFWKFNLFCEYFSRKSRIVTNFACIGFWKLAIKFAKFMKTSTLKVYEGKRSLEIP